MLDVNENQRRMVYICSLTPTQNIATINSVMRRSQRALQLDLQLETPAGWGGRRPCAGRKRGPDSHVPHLTRESFSRRDPLHVTLRVRRGIPSLRKHRVLALLHRSFAHACERPEFRLVHYSVQSNHLHLIVEAEGREALAAGMKSC